MKKYKFLTAIVLGFLFIFLVAASPLAIRYFFGGLVIVGTRDETQLRVTGYTTQTTNLMVLEQSDGTDVLTVTNAGNLSYSGASSFNGNTTIAGTVLVDGQADAVQLTAQGFTTQTTNLLTLEQSNGTDVLGVTNNGNLTLAGTVQNSTGAFTIADNTLVDGQADANQLTVQGYTTQTTNLLTLEQSNGTDVLVVDNTGNLTMAGTIANNTGAFTVADTLQVTGVADFDAGLTFGPTPLFPLGISVASQEIVCATTDTFTGSTTIDVTALTTATYVLASQVTAPITTAAYLYVSDPTTTTVTLTSLESTGFGAGTTGIVAHYCVVGVE